MAKPNIKGVMQSLAGNPVLKRNIQELAYSRLEVKKEKLLGEFNNHVVTKELEDPTGENSSRTLDGVEGNLFAFIGFEEGDNPTDTVRDIINDIKLDRRTDTKISGNNILYSIGLKTPKIDDIENKTPIPWEPTRSWLYGIERGISGLSYFISKLAGRSGGGIQTESQVRQAKFNNISYWSEMYNKFLNSLNK